MKTLLIIIAMIVFAMDIFVPGDKIKKRSKQTVTCAIGYNAEEDAILYEDSLAHCNYIEIRSVPPAENANIAVKSIFTKGSYDIKCAVVPTLENGFDYVLEDQLTGANYNLRSEGVYHFNVSRTIADRFVLRVKKSASVTAR